MKQYSNMGWIFKYCFVFKLVNNYLTYLCNFKTILP